MATDDIISTENYFLREDQSISSIPSTIENLFIKDYNCDLNSILFVNTIIGWKSINIGADCFQHVREFVIDGLERLESVQISGSCFRIRNDHPANIWDAFILPLNKYRYFEERDDGICRITNCPNLHQLEIGDESFADFQSFEISNLNSLQSIEFGNCCFEFADFVLKGE